MALDNEDIKQLIAILQKGLTDDSSQEEIVPKTKNKSTKSNKKIVSEEPPKTKLKRGKVEAQSSTNQFLTMGFNNLHKEDTAIDKILAQSPRTPRRKKFQTINVVCRSCGKKESISPSLLYDAPDRYKCNRCSTSPG